ncbi:MAG: hypothetical protein C0504_15210 [Candidatus Solibacter sp.]|nr:hypothetical protein [Candidatus Solibacter sp.]
MKLIIGPPGSGKTTMILDAVRARLSKGDGRFRLVVPTSTMAAHTRNVLAREGFLVRPSRIITLAGLISELLPETRAAGETELILIVEEALERLKPRAFASAMDTPGLAAAIAGAMLELAGAGCGPDQWQALGSMRVWTSPAMADLGKVYTEVEAELTRRQLLMAPALVSAAASAIIEGALRGCDALYFDGFFTLSPVEVSLIRAAARRLRVTITLPEWPGAAEARQILRAAGAEEQRLSAVRSLPKVEIAPAATIHREAAEIARRILGLREQGLGYSQIGVVVRSAGPFPDLIESAFSRFGIPFRSFLAKPLAAHPIAVWFPDLAAAVASGWEADAALPVLRNPAFRAGVSPAIERFTARVIEAMPCAGIDRLKAEAAKCQDSGEILAALDALAVTGAWTERPLTAAQWAGALQPLLLLALPPDNATPEAARLSRARAAAITAVTAALDSAALLTGDEPVAFDAYWRHAWLAIQGAGLRLAGSRRDAVALMDVYEARQWELPAVFIAGLLEGEFPRHPGIEPILANDLRIRARQSGVLLRTREGRDQEERFLFSLAISRATELAVLSYPQFDGKGEATLPSFELASIAAEAMPAQPVRIRSSRPAPAAPPPVLESASARAALRSLHETHSGTALEAFLSCPFIFFARQSLRLEQPPARPAERLDMLVLGSLVHAVIVEWHKRGGPVEAVFESHWERLTHKLRVPPGYHAEFERLRALRALRHYAADPKIDAGFQASFEQTVKVTLDSGEVVKGRIDRYDVDEEGNCRVIDFKYSRASKLERLKSLDEAGALLQLGIYLAAVRDMGHKPQAAAYVPLRSAEVWKFKDGAAEMIQSALDRAGSAAARILDGVIAPDPAIEDVCEYCEMKSACRITELKRGRTVPATA